MSLMKVFTSDIFQFPSLAFEIEISSPPRACLAARDTKSAYWEDTAVVFSKIALSKFVARPLAASKSSRKAAIYPFALRTTYCLSQGFVCTHCIKIVFILGSEERASRLHISGCSGVVDNGIPNVADRPSNRAAKGSNVSQIHRNRHDRKLTADMFSSKRCVGSTIYGFIPANSTKV